MPNHCSNSLHIDGELKHRQEFVDKNKGFHWGDVNKEKEYHNLSFHAQVPVPNKHIASHAKDSSNSDWYSWVNRNWGTKWDCYELEMEHNKQYTYYSFDTAWGSPDIWVKKVSKKFPNLKFNVDWAEEGGSGGRYLFEKGKLLWAVGMTEQEWKDYMGYTDGEEEEW